MQRYLRLALLALIAHLSPAVWASVLIVQPETLSGGMPGHDGRQIQLQFTFVEPIAPNESFSILINERAVTTVHNKTSESLMRFVTRLRMRTDESISVLRENAQFKTKIDFSPKVVSNYQLPDKHEYNPSPRVLRVSSPQLKSAYGAEVGDCLYLLLGISNSGPNTPKSYEFITNLGSIHVKNDERISTNPLFGFGFKGVVTKCEFNIQK